MTFQYPNERLIWWAVVWRPPWSSPLRPSCSNLCTLDISRMWNYLVCSPPPSLIPLVTSSWYLQKLSDTIRILEQTIGDTGCERPYRATIISYQLHYWTTLLHHDTFYRYHQGTVANQQYQPTLCRQGTATNKQYQPMLSHASILITIISQFIGSYCSIVSYDRICPWRWWKVLLGIVRCKYISCVFIHQIL